MPIFIVKSKKNIARLLLQVQISKRNIAASVILLLASETSSFVAGVNG
jgi:hypothetical protein